IGFTVSLLIGELAFQYPEHVVQAKTGTLAASLIAALLAVGALLRRSRAHGRAAANGTAATPE
ncbi:MAG TPA: Na+/H+ antiporter NhaA, partial [Candidatus Nanopelagicales bacterium]|nr:Na+/H+ antiporter NhaA [Candidatus Nanopelagicales bacterium]